MYSNRQPPTVHTPATSTGPEPPPPWWEETDTDYLSDGDLHQLARMTTDGFAPPPNDEPSR
jgi:hypothetical protein